MSIPAILLAIPVALSAFLLFLVQPIAARSILTWFGGAPAVWTTCLVFFQAVLVAGYGYAHWLGQRAPRIRLLVHLGVLLVAGAFLPLAADPSWKPNGAEAPLPRILGFLAATVGLPYFALAATSPLVQRIAAEQRAGRDPYRLTALSNAASLAGLLVYPFAVEPNLSMLSQQREWSIGFAVFAVAMLVLLVAARRGGTVVVEAAAETVEKRTRFGALTWFALAAFPSMMLAATTNELCIEVAAVPFLWVLPLAVYLLTFVIAFEFPRIYVRPVFGVFLLMSSLGVGLLRALGGQLSLPIQIAGYGAALLFCCMACHGELARMKPEPRRLTQYHFTIALGGVVGSAFVAIVAPAIFRDYHELYLGLGGCSVTLLITWLRSGETVFYANDPRSDRVGIGLWAVGFVMVFYAETSLQRGNALLTHRDFHGVVSVIRMTSAKETYDFLRHGRTQHGVQLVRPERRHELTSYYCEGSGFYLAVLNHAKRRAGEPMRFGVVGLGIGVIAAYGAKGDSVRFYELSPAVEGIARSHFSFLADSAATTEVVFGDARLSLERELAAGERQAFDIIAVDAFSSDAVPRHLITREAIALYLEHLAPGGFLCVQISNRYLDLKPLVKALAEAHGLASVLVMAAQPKNEVWRADSTWVILSRDPGAFQTEGWKGKTTPWPKDLKKMEPWTDDFGGLFSIIRW